MNEILKLTDVLSSAMTPVTLITGVAFLTSIMAPRFGRCIDRIRGILSRIKTINKKDREYGMLVLQLKILYKRTKTLRNTMTAAGICILLVVITIAFTFAHVLIGYPGVNVSLVTFFFALLSLVVLVIGFIYDFLSSLQAVKLEIFGGLDHDDLHVVYDEIAIQDNAVSDKIDFLKATQLH